MQTCLRSTRSAEIAGEIAVEIAGELAREMDNLQVLEQHERGELGVGGEAAGRWRACAAAGVLTQRRPSSRTPMGHVTPSLATSLSLSLPPLSLSGYPSALWPALTLWLPVGSLAGSLPNGLIYFFSSVL